MILIIMKMELISNNYNNKIHPQIFNQVNQVTSHKIINKIKKNKMIIKLTMININRIKIK